MLLLIYMPNPLCEVYRIEIITFRYVFPCENVHSDDSRYQNLIPCKEKSPEESEWSGKTFHLQNIQHPEQYYQLKVQRYPDQCP